MMKNLYWKIIYSKYVSFSIKPVIRHLGDNVAKIENSIYYLTHFGEYEDLESTITLLESENDKIMNEHIMYIKSLENDFNFGVKKKISVSDYPAAIDQNLIKIATLEEKIRKRSKIIERKDVKFLRLTLSFIIIFLPMIIGLSIISYLKELKSLFSNKSGVVSKDKTDNNQKSDDTSPF